MKKEILNLEVSWIQSLVTMNTGVVAVSGAIIGFSYVSKLVQFTFLISTILVVIGTFGVLMKFRYLYIEENKIDEIFIKKLTFIEDLTPYGYSSFIGGLIFLILGL